MHHLQATRRSYFTDLELRLGLLCIRFGAAGGMHFAAEQGSRRFACSEPHPLHPSIAPVELTLAASPIHGGHIVVFWKWERRVCGIDGVYRRNQGRQGLGNDGNHPQHLSSRSVTRFVDAWTVQ